MIKVYYQHEETGNTIEVFYKNKKSIKELGRYNIYKTEEVKTNSYIIVSNDIDSFQINVVQDVNRPNNLADEEVIKEYILNNFGEKTYEIVILENMLQVTL